MILIICTILGAKTASSAPADIGLAKQGRAEVPYNFPK
jgi:hypothetical protein